MINMKFLTFNNKDFPYYNHNPRISKSAWIVLLFSVPISFLLYSIIGLYSEFIGSIIFCSVMLIPLLYYSKWDYSLIFQKPSRNEIILGIILFISYIIYAGVMGSILDMFNITNGDTSIISSVNPEIIVSLIFSMMGEELIKFIPLMFFMRLFFKFTKNREYSIILSSIISLICFGLLHYSPGMSLVSVLLLQGLGSIFELYGYIKTKNLFVPYISHLLTDALIMTIILIGT